MRHNADWQTHNYPSLGEKNWSMRGGPQCRVILLKAGIPPDFAGMQVSKSPTPLLRGLCPLRTCCSLTEDSDKADKTGDTLLFSFPCLCAVATANIYQEPHVSLRHE